MSCLMSWLMFFETYTVYCNETTSFCIPPKCLVCSCRTLQRFSLEQRLYTSEGINWSHITWQDTWSTDDTVRHQFTDSFERNSLDTMFVKHLSPHRNSSKRTCRHFSSDLSCFKHLEIIPGCCEEPLWYQPTDWICTEPWYQTVILFIVGITLENKRSRGFFDIWIRDDWR